VKLFRIHAARHYHRAAVSIRLFRSASFDAAPGVGIFRPRGRSGKGSIGDTAGRAYWPRFEAAAQARGIRSCLGLPLVADGKPVGVLNLYGRGVAAFGPDQVHRAEKLAENASGALSLMLRLASYSELTDQLRSSLTSRAVIYQALGVIMAQERCTQAKAFEMLRGASQNSNVKLRDIASAIVTSVSGEPPQPHAFEEG